MLIMHRLGLSMLLSLRISGETTGAIVAEQNQVTATLERVCHSLTLPLL